MKTRTTLLLLALVGGLAAFIAFYEIRLPKSWQTGLNARRALVFERENVTGIDIQNNDETLQLCRSGKAWRIEAPFKDAASPEAVEEFLSLCREAGREPTRDPADKTRGEKTARLLNRTGLAKPSLSLKLSGSGKMPPAIFFGKETAVEGKIYFREETSNAVFVTGEALRNRLQRPADSFRSPVLADFDAARVRRVQIKTGAGEIELARPDEHWLGLKPTKCRADDARVEAFLNSVLHTRIARFLPAQSAAQHGLAEPRCTVSFWGAGTPKRPATLELGAADPQTGGLYARFQPRGIVVLLPKESANILAITPATLRDRHLVRIDMDYVDRITFRPADGPPVIYHRSEENWVRKTGQAASQTAAPVPAGLVPKFVDAVQSRVAAFVTDVAADLAPYGLDRPALRVTFSSWSSENTAEGAAGEEPILTLAFGKTGDGKVYARVEEEPLIVTVETAFVEALRRSMLP